MRSFEGCVAVFYMLLSKFITAPDRFRWNSMLLIFVHSRQRDVFGVTVRPYTVIQFIRHGSILPVFRLALDPEASGG